MPLHIAICGGGIGGLAVAIGLIKQNIKVSIYEQSPTFREIGAGIGFGKNSMTAMRLIDPELYAGFMKIATDNGSESSFDTWFDFFAGMDIGGVAASTALGTIKVDGGSAQCMASRAEFLDEMAKLIPPGTAQFNKKVQHYNLEDPKKVAIHFADGSKTEADAVIGCDGVRATSRATVLDGDPEKLAPVFTSKYAYRGLIPMDRAIEALGEIAATNRRMYLGHHGHLLCFPVAQCRMMNIVAFKDKPDGVWDNPSWIESATKEEMVNDFSGFSDMFQKILGLVEKPERWAIFDHNPATTFFKDRICLLGDSAHASSPHFGAGAGMAIEDAYILSALLGLCDNRQSIKSAFAAYDAVRRPRTHRVMKASRVQGRFLDLEEPRQWKGSKLDLDALKKGLAEDVQFIWMEDLPAELEIAKSIFYYKEESSGNAM